MEMTFVNVRKLSILGLADDYGYDEYDIVEEEQEEEEEEEEEE